MNRWAKMPLLRSMQQVVELHESSKVLADIGNQNPAHQFGDLKVPLRSPRPEQCLD